MLQSEMYRHLHCTLTHLDTQKEQQPVQDIIALANDNPPAFAMMHFTEFMQELGKKKNELIPVYLDTFLIGVLFGMLLQDSDHLRKHLYKCLNDINEAYEKKNNAPQLPV